MSKSIIQIVLNEDKDIRGKKIKAGTVLGEISCLKRFTREDIDLGMQLGQVKIVETVDRKEKERKEKEEKERKEKEEQK